MSKRTDIFTKEIIKNGLDEIAEEMFWVTIRASKSPIFYETYDFSSAITMPNGDIVSISIGLPLWIGVMKYLVNYVIREIGRRDGLAPGDVVVTNDPYETGTHLNDIAVVMPIFHGDEIVAVAAAKGHVNDVGGMNPGSWGPGSSEIYQEGVFIPPVKLYREGKLNNDVMDIILANTRIPDYLKGDLEALVAGLRVAERRIQKLIEKYGAEAVCESMSDKIEDGVRIALRELEKLPKGKFHAEDYLDDDYVTGNPLRIEVDVEISAEKFKADFSKAPRAVPAPLNTTYPATVAAVAVVFTAIVAPHVPFNQGLLYPLEVVAPEGSLFNAKRPYPVSVYWETMTYAADLVWKALAPYLPERLSAGHFLSVAAETIAGIDPRTGEYFILCEPNPGGWGASADKDGESSLVSFADGETYANPVEVLEIRFPVIVRRMELNVYDGVGHGKFRGGFGIVKDYEILADEALLTTAINRSRFVPWGVNGGLSGTPNYIVVIRDGKEILRINRILNFKLKKGDIVSIRTGGGGGWGDPLERDPKMVQQDVINGLISIEKAREVYGVVMDPVTKEVLFEETNKLREELRKSRHK